MCIWGVESGVSQCLFLRIWFKSEQSNYTPQLVAVCQPVGCFLLSIFPWENTPRVMSEECSLLWWDTAFLPCAAPLIFVGQVSAGQVFADWDQEQTHFLVKNQIVNILGMVGVWSVVTTEFCPYNTKEP